MVRIPPAENMLHEAPRSDMAKTNCLVSQWDRKAVNFLGLPPLLDAVVDKSHETGCHDHAGAVSDCSTHVWL